MCSIPHHFLSTDNIYPFASCRQVYLLSFQVVALACAGSIRRNGADARGVGYGQLILSLLGLVAVVSLCACGCDSDFTNGYVLLRLQRVLVNIFSAKK